MRAHEERLKDWVGSLLYLFHCAALTGMVRLHQLAMTSGLDEGRL
jgi:hypothetical protein